jgi:hypothetical protein
VLFDTECDGYFGEYSKPQFKKKTNNNPYCLNSISKISESYRLFGYIYKTCCRLVMITSIQK